jgi:hypothetical protein
MSTHSTIHRSLVAAFVLSIAGVAFARQPPALTQAQSATEYAVACEGARAEQGAGYRGALERSGARPGQAAPTTVAKAGSGYRDSVKRFGVGTASAIACEHPKHAPRTAASL